ncbi:helix-turn-helix transcriptional regulator [Burkholderia sp. MR1-5-21]
MLPPLMFSQSELEALMLGFRWVAKCADVQLTSAASDALAKISAVLPGELRRELESTTLLVGPRAIDDRETIDMENRTSEGYPKLVNHLVTVGAVSVVGIAWTCA